MARVEKGVELAVHREDQRLIADLAREVIGDVRPADLRYFDVDVQAYFDDPDRALGRVRKQTTLGSGLEDVAVALTPFVLFVAQRVFDSVIQEAVKDGRERLRLWRKKRAPAGPIEPLDAQQVEAVHGVVVKCAREQGVGLEVAERIAQALVARLLRKEGL